MKLFLIYRNGNVDLDEYESDETDYLMRRNNEPNK